MACFVQVNTRDSCVKREPSLTGSSQDLYTPDLTHMTSPQIDYWLDSLEVTTLGIAMKLLHEATFQKTFEGCGIHCLIQK